MRDPNAKIPFYKERTFGEKFDDTFAFVRQNFRYMLKPLLYVVLPVCLVGGLCLQWFMSFAGNADAVLDLIGSPVYWLLLVLAMVLGAVATAAPFALMQIYNDRPEGLQGLTWSALSHRLWRDTGRVVVCALIILVMSVLVGLLCTLLAVVMHLLSVLIILPLLFVYMVVVAMILPTYLYEDISIWRAIGRGLMLGWRTFGGILGVVVVFMIISQVITMVFAIPWYACFFLLFATSDGTTADVFALSPMFATLSYLSSVLMYIGSVLSTMLLVVALSYQYAHAAEKNGSMSVEQDIDDFETL